jgi:hypothetical protein
MEKDMSREACRKAYQERQDILAKGVSFATFYGRVQQYGWSYDKAATTPLGGDVKAGVRRMRPRGKYNPNDLLIMKEQLTQDITSMRVNKPCKEIFKFCKLFESTLRENNTVVYRTYADKPYFNDIDGSFLNKPSKGLWGCRDDSWKEWCKDNNFEYNSNYFEWILKPGAKVFTINTKEDFTHLLKKYGSNLNGIYSIDYLKLANDYDAVELTKEGNLHLHYSINVDDPELQDTQYKYALLMALNMWDVPSICVFHPKETIEILS